MFFKRTEQKRNEFVVDDVLHFSNDDTSTLLVQTLVAPMTVDFDEEVGDAVVFSHPYLIHVRQADEFVHSEVTCLYGLFICPVIDLIRLANDRNLNGSRACWLPAFRDGCSRP